jgi:hypothetical protein
MKAKFIALAVLTILGCAVALSMLRAADDKPARGVEYVTIRWGGKENTHIIRPGGQVEFIGHELRKAVRPDRTDERAFYMNLAMNGLTKGGYEFAGMTSDEIVMKREFAR